MFYPDHDITGATWTAPFTLRTSSIPHCWAGWTWQVLGLADVDEVDVWRYKRVPPGCSTSQRRTEHGHGIDLREWMELAHPTYDREHATRLIVQRYVDDWEIDIARACFAQSSSYIAAIEELRRMFVASCRGFMGGNINYWTRAGFVHVEHPLVFDIPLVEVARRAFPEPLQPVQLAMF